MIVLTFKPIGSGPLGSIHDKDAKKNSAVYKPKSDQVRAANGNGIGNGASDVNATSNGDDRVSACSYYNSGSCNVNLYRHRIGTNYVCHCCSYCLRDSGKEVTHARVDCEVLNASKN